MNNILKKIIIFFIKLYQYTLSPMLGRSKCRYDPSCSHYMVQAIEEWGAWKGIWLGLKRIGRCHPWAKTWGYDPIPKKKNL